MRNQRGGAVSHDRVGFIAAAFVAALGSALASASEPHDAQPISTRELVEVRDLSGIAVSPNGEYSVVRMETPDIDANQVHLAWYWVPLAKRGRGRPDVARKIADAGEPTLQENGVIDTQTPLWSEDSKWIYYRALQDQEMQVWRTRWSDGRSEQLTHDAANVKGIHPNELHERLFYWVGADRQEIIEAEREQYDNGVLNEGSLLPGFPVARSYPIFGRLSMYRLHRNSTGPSRYSHTGLLADRPDRLMVLSLSSGAARPATEAETADYEALLRQHAPGPWGGWSRSLSSDGRRVAMVGESQIDRKSQVASKNRVDGEGQVDGESEDVGLRWAPTSNPSAAVACRHPACAAHVDGPKLLGWLDDTNVVFSNKNLTGQGLYVWDVAANRVRRFAFTEGLYAGDRFDKDVCAIAHKERVRQEIPREEILCIASGAATAPRLEAISPRTGKARILFDPNPNLKAKRLGIAERLLVKNEYGDEMAAFLILPRGRAAGERVPLGITSYSCDGFLRGGSGDDVPEHLLATAGIAAVCLNDNAEAERVERPGDYWANNESSSLAFRRAIVELLDLRGLIDPNRVGITGLSYAATATLHAISRTDQFAVAEITSQGYEDPIDAWFMGVPPAHSPFLEPEYYKSVSPALNADKIHTPLLMLLSDTEYLQMLELYSTLRDLHKPVEMTVFADEYHIKGQPRHRLAVYDQSVAWLRFWLKGEEDPAAAPRDRNQRWENLCAAQARENPARRLYCVRPAVQ
jgi:dipeptidyl aminopeptidase/acylaminoacyl peptidase